MKEEAKKEDITEQMSTGDFGETTSVNFSADSASENLKFAEVLSPSSI
jgi:hypothetical protein